jgi:DNA-directed RNA polymerase subunit RPC12/RpoP
MHTLTPGAWYLMFICSDCSTRQVLFRDLSDGTSRLMATYTVTCQNCGHKAAYDSASIERFQCPLKTEAAEA